MTEVYEVVLQQLAEACKFYQEHPDDDDGYNLNLNEIWRVIVDLARKDVVLLGKFYPFLNVLKEYDVDFQEINPDIIPQIIQNISNESTSEEERNIDMLVIARLLPFLNIDNAKKAISAFIEVASDLIVEETTIPKKITKIFDEVSQTSLNSDVIKAIFKQIQTKIDSDSIAGALVVLACLSDAIFESVDCLDSVLDNISAGLDGDDDAMVAACYLIHKCAPSFEEADDSDDFDPKELFEDLVPALYSDDEDVRYYGRLALKTLINGGVFQSKSIAISLIKNFNNFNTPELLPVFFKNIRLFIKAAIVKDDNDIDLEEEDFDEDPVTENPKEEEDLPEEEEEDGDDTIESIEPIFGFCSSALKSTQATGIVNGCIRTIADIIAVDNSIVVPVQKQIRNIIYNLVDKRNYESFHSISYFLRSSFENANLSGTSKLASRLRMILHGAKKESTGTEKERLQIVENVSQIARGVRKWLVPNVFDIGFQQIGNDDEDLAALGASIVGAVSKSLDKANAVESFLKISQRSIKLQYADSFYEMLDDLTRLTANQYITEKDTEMIIKCLLEGKCEALDGVSIGQASPPAKSAFRLIGSCLKLHKTSPETGKALVEIGRSVSKENAPFFIKASIDGVKAGCIEGRTIMSLPRRICEFMQTLDISDTREAIACVDGLKAVYERSPNAFDPIKSAFPHLSKMVADAPDDDEEEDGDETETDEVLTAIADFVFLVYRSNTAAKVDEDLVAGLMDNIAIASEDEHVPPLVDSMMALAKDPRFECVRVLILSSFASMVAMTTDEFDELELRKGALDQMVQIIRDAIRHDKSIVPQLVQDFSDDGEKVKRFRALCRH